MSFLKRAFLYVKRKRGKSLLLFVILLVMATFVLTGISIWKASEAMQRELRRNLGGTFQLLTDYSDENPHMHKEQTNDNNFIWYSTEQLSSETVGAIRQIPGVKYCAAEAEVLADFQELSLFPGTVPISEEFRRMTMTEGTWRTGESQWFTGGSLTLEEGRHIGENDRGCALISRDLAEKCGLGVGDWLTTTSTTGKELKLQIVGLFSPRATEKFGEQVTSYEKIQNRVFVDWGSAVAIEDSEAIQGFSTVNITVEDPQDLDGIIAQVRQLPAIDWKGFTIGQDTEAYTSAAAPLSALNELVVTLLAVILAVSALILSLILALWAKTRIHETGVFLSVGIRKSAILGQYLTEVLLIAVLAFGVSYFASNAVSDQIGGRLMELSVQEEQQNRDGTGASASVDVGGVQAPEPELQISIGVGSLGLLCLIGFAVIILAVSVSSVTVMRMRPREILSKMS